MMMASVNSNADNLSNRSQSDSIAQQSTVVAPVSLYTLLSLLVTDLSGTARTELNAVMGGFLNEDTLQDEMDSLISRLSSSSFVMVNILLVAKSLAINEIFIYRARQVFHAEIMALEVDRISETIATINMLTPSATAGQIDAAVDSNVFANSPRLVLLNMVHLNASWHQAFHSQLTTERSFFIHDEKTNEAKQIQVPTMRLLGDLSYTEHDTFTAIDLCLRGNGGNRQLADDSDYVMTVLLPNRNISLRRLENELAWWELLLPNACKRRNVFLDLRLPRFNASTHYSFIEPLQRMGVKKIFNGNRQAEKAADNPFANLFTSPSESENLVVNRIEQRARIEVNEAGLIASRATTRRIPHRMMRRPRIIDVNRPFMFLLWHLSTQSVLFAGSVRDPTWE